MTNYKEFKILQPKYYSKFQCDPNRCHETCCERWKIIIDKDTYEKYVHSDNSTIQELVKTGLSVKEGSQNDDDFAYVNLNKEMLCPFLNQKGLCEVYINMGEHCLSKTCKSYPRALVLVDDAIERGLEMSCSVAAELALLNHSGIEFENITEPISFNDYYVVSPAFENLNQIESMKEIRVAVIEILQTRTMKLSERVAAVGYFLTLIQGEKDLTGVRKAKSLINLREFKIFQNEHKPLYKTQFDHLNTILSMKFQQGDTISFFSKRYVECLMQVLDAFGRIKSKELEKQYKANCEKYLKPYLDKKTYILENLLVNYVFIYSCEFFNLDNLWTSYMKLCIIYGLLKFNLIGLATYHKGMNDDLVLKLIQSLWKTIVTDKTYLESVINYLIKEDLVELNKILTLIAD